MRLSSSDISISQKLSASYVTATFPLLFTRYASNFCVVLLSLGLQRPTWFTLFGMRHENQVLSLTVTFGTLGGKLYFFIFCVVSPHTAACVRRSESSE
jgi:hypothetical protein